MKKYLIALLVLSGLCLKAQTKELGKVTIEELKQKTHPNDSSAAAAVLFEVGRTSFEYSQTNGFEIVTEVLTKIKIYKKEGYEYANKSASYYIGGSASEKLEFSKAITYNLMNGKIEKTKLGSDGEFIEKVNKNWARKKISMPNVKEGSIIEYKMTLRSPYITNFPDWQFQRDIPVSYSEYTTYVPEYYVYNVRNKGFLSPVVKKENTQNSITSTSKERGWGVTTKFDQNVTNYKELKTNYVLTDVPALKDESYVNNINNYKTTVIHELAGERFPNRAYENYATDWETVVKKIYENEDFGNELNKTGYFEKDLDAILKGSTSLEEKMAVVFNYVKARMNWNEYYGYTCDNGVRKAYQEKTGNAAEINLMLTAMLRYAGFEANPVLISTRSNGIALFPSRTAFNYVIAGIELNNRVVLLDATDKNALPDILPTRDLNWLGRIIRKNNSSAEIDLMPKSNSKEVMYIMANVSPEGNVSGKIRDQYFDYNAFVFRGVNNKVAKDSYVEKLEKRHQGLEITDYAVQNNNDLSKPIQEEYSFTSNNSVEIIGDKMYFSPFLYLAMTENPFKQETREYPVDFVYPHQDKFVVSITVPEGYAIETLPQSKSIGMPDELGNFRYNISSNGNQIQLLYTIDINQAIISSEYYESLKGFYKEVVDKQTEKIVLKKA
ncbi:transglutaminase domain-containing protein [Flavobacterium humi]|uniref:DUF3857 domain-containing protein n=1 Tax=Flavobacterium humi TaxID=2562683 RepID=A0A4Z0L4W9_9FLAO|nr:transglutaminase domain-containing protein [Flavobacterium humi]TGD57408.1 DUF3857 domain-containing protein [Flavobacterium humi]